MLPICRQLLSDRNNVDNCSLLVASGLFARRHDPHRLLPSFVDIAVKYYNVTIQTLDFVGDPYGARVHINEWISNNTAGNIRHMLGSGSVSQRTVVAFVNAVYFKALWRVPFNAHDNRKGMFFVSSAQAIEVVMMSVEARFSFVRVHDLHCRVIELPYSAGDLSMYVLLPDDFSLSRLERRLNSSMFDDIVRRIPTPRMLKLTMPKFSQTTTVSLARILTEMGMADLFDVTAADLSGLSDNMEMFVSDFVHRMRIDVSEDGTEAAAASIAIVGLTSFPPPIPTFVVDKPFMLLVRERTMGAILFMGRLMTPSNQDAIIGAYGVDSEEFNAATCKCGGAFLALGIAYVLALMSC